MVSSISSSLSGIKAAFELQNASAKNTANANTDGYKKDIVTLSETKDGGVETTTSKSDSPGYLYDKSGNLVESSNVNYADEAVSQINAKHMLKANLAALKTADEMQESVIDILA